MVVSLDSLAVAITRYVPDPISVVVSYRRAAGITIPRLPTFPRGSCFGFTTIFPLLFRFRFPSSSLIGSSTRFVYVSCLRFEIPPLRIDEITRLTVCLRSCE